MITQEKLKRIFKYDNGCLFWTKESKMKGKVGKRAGRTKPSNDGYYSLTLEGKVYRVHRLVFLYHKGYLPSLVDHINRDKLDNRIENLRESTKKDNAENSKLYSSNTSGHVGVSLDKASGKWKSYRWNMGKYINLGFYDTIEEAIEARRNS